MPFFRLMNLAARIGNAIYDLFIDDSDKHMRYRSDSDRYLLGNPAVTLTKFINSIVAEESIDTTMDVRDVLGLSAAWRCIRLLSEPFAGVNLYLYEKNDNGDITIPQSHPLNEMFSTEVSGFYSAFTWKETGQVHLALRGNTYSFVKRRPGKKRSDNIESFLLIDPDKVDTVAIDLRTETTKYYIQQKIFEGEDILHVPGFGYNGIVGFNPIEIHRTTFQVDKASMEYQKNFFSKGAFLSGYITCPNALDERVIQNVKDSFLEEYGGYDKSGGVPILDLDMEFKPLKINPVDAEWINTRRNSAEEASRIFGVPLYMLNVKMDNQGYNSIEQLGLEFKSFTLTPYTKRWAAELNRKLIPKEERQRFFIDFDLMTLMLSDLDTMREWYIGMHGQGILNRNEIRKEMRRNSVPWGDEYFIQGNNYITVESAINQSKTLKDSDSEADIKSVKEK